MNKRKTKGNPRIDEALLELAQDFRGTLLSNETADKITMRILGDKAPAKPAPLEPRKSARYAKTPIEPSSLRRHPKHHDRLSFQA